MVMLTAYFDESENTPLEGKPEKLRVYTIAGCIGLDRQWVKFQKKWKAILDRDVLPKWRVVYGEHKPVFFHMTDFANPHSKVYGDWPEEKKIKFLGELHDIMAKPALRRFATGVLINDYEELTDEEQFVFGHPHAAGTINCMKRIRDWAIRENRREPMLYVFEKGSAHDRKIRKLFEATLSDENKAEYRVGGLAFKDKRESSPLQASDILAVESRWEVCRQFDPAITRAQRRSLKNLIAPNVDEWYFLDKAHMRAVLENPSVKKAFELEGFSEHAATAKRKGWI
jgi:hypothetical protein